MVAGSFPYPVHVLGALDPLIDSEGGPVADHRRPARGRRLHGSMDDQRLSINHEPGVRSACAYLGSLLCLLFRPRI